MQSDTKVDIRTVLCRSCRMPANLNDAGDCELCEKRVSAPYPMPWMGIAMMTVAVFLFVAVGLGLCAMKSR